MLGDRWITDRTPTKRFPGYTRANAGEVLADPVSPLAWTFVWESSVVIGCAEGFATLGVFDVDEYGTPPESFGLFGGYFYNSLTQARLFGVRSGAGWEAIDKAYFDNVPDVPPYVEEDWHESPRHSEKLAKSMAWFMTTPDVPAVELQKHEARWWRESRPDLSALSNEQLVARAHTAQRPLRDMFAQHAWVSLGASIGPGVLGALTAELGIPGAVTKLITSVGDVDSADISTSVWHLSRIARDPAVGALFDAGPDALLDRSRGATAAREFCAAYDAFVVEHGSRGPNEWDVWADTYETKPELALSAVDRLRHVGDDHSPHAGHVAGVAARERVAAEVEAALAGNAEALATFHAAMNSARVFLGARERCKGNNIRIIGEMRMCFYELGRRMVAAGHLAHHKQICMLLEDEIDDFLVNPGAYTDLLAERERDYLALYELEPPFIVNGSVAPLAQWKRKRDVHVDTVAPGDVLQGVAGSPGTVTGRARVVLDPADPVEFEPGDVLVAPHTDPAWTPLFLMVDAVVVNVGAIGTHAVIVSREIGIPCVPSIADATARIPDGATITVDGTVGTVTIVAV